MNNKIELVASNVNFENAISSAIKDRGLCIRRKIWSENVYALGRKRELTMCRLVVIVEDNNSISFQPLEGSGWSNKVDIDDVLGKDWEIYRIW